MIGWVENTDTIGKLVEKYRRINNIQVDLEWAISEEICKDYEMLPKINKIELFREIESRVSGEDLKSLFWMRASTS